MLNDKLKYFSRSLRQFFKKLIWAGVGRRNYSGDHRIALFCNVNAVLGILGSSVVFFQLYESGIHFRYLVFYFFIVFASLLVISLNYMSRHIAARVVTAILLNMTAWNALIIWGTSFNGYLVFFVALVFSVVAFDKAHKPARWLFLSLSWIGLPVADYLSHAGLVPLTSFHSSQMPLSVLVFDTLSIQALITTILLIEKYLSEKYEQELIVLNCELEEIVDSRTQMLHIARDEAMAASQAKSQFIANTSHELRTPITAIIGFVDLLIKSNPDEPQRSKYLDTVRRNSRQLLDIVNDVLDLSKIEAQKFEIEKTTFSLDEFLKDLKILMDIKASRKKLRFDIKKMNSLPDYIFSDSLRLKQILINLLGNAFKFTDRGHVYLRVQLDPSGEFMLFDIEDTGPGITDQYKRQLFEPFSQDYSQGRRRVGGTGLGLSLSNKLAGLLDGRLSLLKTKVGEGSTFRLRIPLPSKDQAFTDEAISTQEEISGWHDSRLENKDILIVEDSPDNQQLLCQYLTMAGARVEFAENGQVALDKVSGQEFDAILMDLQMPVMDGYEATKQLRQQGYTKPIIACTAHAIKEEKDRATKFGFCEYLAKPITQAQLVATILDQINKSDR